MFFNLLRLVENGFHRILIDGVVLALSWFKQENLPMNFDECKCEPNKCLKSVNACSYLLFAISRSMPRFSTISCNDLILSGFSVDLAAFSCACARRSSRHALESVSCYYNACFDVFPSPIIVFLGLIHLLQQLGPWFLCLFEILVKLLRLFQTAQHLFVVILFLPVFYILHFNMQLILNRQVIVAHLFGLFQRRLPPVQRRVVFGRALQAGIGVLSQRR